MGGRGGGKKWLDRGAVRWVNAAAHQTKQHDPWHSYDDCKNDQRLRLARHTLGHLLAERVTSLLPAGSAMKK